MIEKHISPCYGESIHKPGQWITHNSGNPFEIYGECSVCGFEQSIDAHLRYCPNCGASMSDENELKIVRKIPYDRLLKIAKKMHLWIFLHSGDEFAVYKECGLTDEENAELGSIGKIEIHSPKREHELWQ